MGGWRLSNASVMEWIWLEFLWVSREIACASICLDTTNICYGRLKRRI